MRLPEIPSETYGDLFKLARLIGCYEAAIGNASRYLDQGDLTMVRWVLNEQAPSRAAEIVAGTLSESADPGRSERDDDLRSDCMMHG